MVSDSFENLVTKEKAGTLVSSHEVICINQILPGQHEIRKSLCNQATLGSRSLKPALFRNNALRFTI